MKHCERCGYPILDHERSQSEAIQGLGFTAEHCLRVLGARLRVLEAKLLEHVGATRHG